MILVTEILDLIEKLFNLLFLDFKLTVFEVKIENFPNVISIELRQQISNFIFGDEWDIKKVRPKHFEYFLYLFKVILSLLNATLVISWIILLPNDIIDPLSFLF